MSSYSEQETTLATVRLHWGIFIPAVFVLAALSLPLLPVIFFVKVMSGFATLNSQPTPSISWIIWLALIPEAVIFGVVLLVIWLAYLKSEIKLTTKRLIFRTGLLARISGELPLENIESIFIVESFIGRLCGYGTVTVTSIGGRTFALSCIGFAAKLPFCATRGRSERQRPIQTFTPADIAITATDAGAVAR